MIAAGGPAPTTPGATPPGAAGLVRSTGGVPNVVGSDPVVDRDADRLTISHGGADTVVCMDHGRLSEIIGPGGG